MYGGVPINVPCVVSARGVPLRVGLLQGDPEVEHFHEIAATGAPREQTVLAA